MVSHALLTTIGTQPASLFRLLKCLEWVGYNVFTCTRFVSNDGIIVMAPYIAARVFKCLRFFGVHWSLSTKVTINLLRKYTWIYEKYQSNRIKWQPYDSLLWGYRIAIILCLYGTGVSYYRHSIQQYAYRSRRTRANDPINVYFMWPITLS